MSAAESSPVQPPQGSQQQWMHDLRNAVNAVGISIAALENALTREDHARALDLLARAQSASERCRVLLDPRSHPPG